jgi:hypothetical protein
MELDENGLMLSYGGFEVQMDNAYIEVNDTSAASNEQSMRIINDGGLRLTTLDTTSSTSNDIFKAICLNQVVQSITCKGDSHIWQTGAISSPTTLMSLSSAGNLTSTVFTGPLTGVASQATAIRVLTASSDLHRLLFATTASLSYKTAYESSSLTYNAGTSTLACTNFSGTSSQADTLKVNTASSGDHYITFIDTASVTYQTLLKQSSLVYNATSSKLSLPVLYVSDSINMPSTGTSGTPLWSISAIGTAANFHFYLSNTLKCYINLNGTYVTVSDDRVKHNEEELHDSLSMIMQLKPKCYDKSNQMYDEDYNGPPNEGDVFTPETGLIAQDVAQIVGLEHLVHQPIEDGVYAVDYNALFVHHIRATQELNAIITSLTARLEILENK